MGWGEETDGGQADDKEGSHGAAEGKASHAVFAEEGLGTLHGDPPERSAQQFSPLPATDVVEQTFEVGGRRLLVAFEAKKGCQSFFGHNQPSILAEFFEEILQLAMGIKEARAHGAF